MSRCKALLLAAIVGLAVSDTAPVWAGDRLLLTTPGTRGSSAHYARPGDLAVDRRSGYAKDYQLNRRNSYGQPSRVLSAPLDVGATPFERLGRNAEQNEVDIRSRPADPSALAQPSKPYDPSRAPSNQATPPPSSR